MFLLCTMYSFIGLDVTVVDISFWAKLLKCGLCDSLSARYIRIATGEHWEKATQLWQSGICAVVCVQYTVCAWWCLCMCVFVLREWRSPWMAVPLCVRVCIHADTFGACAMALIICIHLHLQRRHKQAVKHTTDSIAKLLLIWTHIRVQNTAPPPPSNVQFTPDVCNTRMYHFMYCTVDDWLTGW